MNNEKSLKLCTRFFRGHINANLTFAVNAILNLSIVLLNKPLFRNEIVAVNAVIFLRSLMKSLQTYPMGLNQLANSSGSAWQVAKVLPRDPCIHANENMRYHTTHPRVTPTRNTHAAPQYGGVNMVSAGQCGLTLSAQTWCPRTH